MSNFQIAAISSALTSVVSALLGYAAAKGIIPVAGVSELAAAITVLLVAGGSWWLNERATKSREAIALNTGITVSNLQPGMVTPQVPAASVPQVIADFAPPNIDVPGKPVA